QRYAERLLGNRTTQVQTAVQNPGGDWQVEFLADPDGEVAEGDILIDSELLLPASPDLGVGERTRRITTIHSGQLTTANVRTAHRAHESSRDCVFARLAY